MLAGNVVASLHAGFLRIVGDNLDNELRVTQSPSDGNRFTVTGLGGTGINGQTSFTARAPRGIIADLKAGDDQLVFDAFSRELIGSIQATLGNGDDLLSAAGLRTNGDLYVNAGAGRDQVAFAQGSFKDCTVLLGEGNDALVFDATRVAGYLSASAAGGDDSIIFGAGTEFLSDVVLQIGNGHDALFVGSDAPGAPPVAFGNQFSLFAGPGDDTALFAQREKDDAVADGKRHQKVSNLIRRRSVAWDGRASRLKGYGIKVVTPGVGTVKEETQ